MRAKPLSIVIAVLLGLAAAPAFAQSPAPASPPATEPAAAPPQDEQDPLASDDPDAAKTDAAKVPLDEIRRYVMVYNAIRQAYVDPVDDRELMQSAVRGLLLDLDPHSAYMKKADAEEFDELTSGAYDGVGLELQQLPEGGVRVVAPLDDGPAERAGLRSRDVIIAIDGKPLVAGEGDASAPLRGKAGTKVVVRIVREGTPKPFDVTLVRETIRTTSVRSRMLEPGFGYVRISSFQAATASDFNKAVDALQKDAPLRGLVLDMRSNPGGLLVGAVQIADELLDKGGIVSTKGRELIGDSRFDATPGDRLKGAPVIVLVDAGSASAAEVLAGALRDNQRARVIGSRTFGKGSVQTLLPLDNGDSIKLTTARYFTPSGHSIQALGIVPDVILHPEGGDRRPVPISEAELPRHLAGETPLEGDNAGEVLPGPKPIDAALLELKRMAGVALAPVPAAPKAKPATKPQ
ncbi:S41 family peptidase [Thermomonas carbonis]|uniref:S41 family peptidase n=1 Tax=Thermomonas carbonis TaxID=1463158 RepID=A0A7G9SSD1_9GAMM|nr:S41 family peptidase [Thermomonas carbonis]QNN70756.1 S41 family peptidase [Thermomonas carbonis]GHC02112.1 peptidase S41 [Thermomonas carbonis]